MPTRITPALRYFSFLALVPACIAAPNVWKEGAELQQTAFPATLSQTNVFKDLATLETTDDILAYSINVPFWSDHAIKSRWIYLPPQGKIQFDTRNSWSFPTGTVWIKHFDLPLDRVNGTALKRIETRLLVKTSTSIEGRTYHWNEEGTEATLVGRQGETVDITLITAPDAPESIQAWRLPSTSECLRCHNAPAGLALGTNTRQLNRPMEGHDEPLNQLTHWQDLGFFSAPLPASPEELPAYPQLTDTNASLTSRARTYLEVNCAQCHQPAGEGLSFFDTRNDTPLAVAGIIYGEVARPAGDNALIVTPGQPDLSVIYQRMSFRGLGQMPLIGTNEVDTAGVALIKEWIETGLTDSLTWDAWYLPVVRNDTDGTLIHSRDYGYFAVIPETEFIYHADHGWQYIFASRQSMAWIIFPWDYGMQSFLYIAPQDFPGWFYRYNDGAWLYFFESEGNNRLFYNASTEAFEWVTKG